MLATKFLPTVLASTLSLLALTSAHDNAGVYTLTDDLSYNNFFSAFDFYTGPDPTQGFVQYQNRTAAVKQQLVWHNSKTKSIFMGADYITKDPKGRASVRLETKKTWNQGLLIADIAHMPASTCGSWPAFWLLGKQDWPLGGEIDILEGVNDYTSNAVTLHTSPGCKVDNTSSLASGGISQSAMGFTGHMATSDCDIAATHQDPNVGCSIRAPSHISGSSSSSSKKPLASYGTPFNAAGGGIYALEWTPTSISVWFLPHSSPLYTSISIAKNTSHPDPSTWGTPLARFAGPGCDFATRFRDLRVVFDTTFCGAWAGREWGRSCMRKTGVKSCEEYVWGNPGAFEEAYWEVRGLRWFGKKGKVRRRDEVVGGKERGRQFRS
jgi:hypothetical protein